MDRYGRSGEFDVPGPPDDATFGAVLARDWWTFALRGIIAMLFGLIAFVVPGAVMLSLALIFAAYLIADGAMGIIAAVHAMRAREHWGTLLGLALLNIVMGIIAFLFPLGAVLAFVIVTAAWALITGGFMLAAAFKVHRDYGRWWLALSGILSVIWGMLLVLAPLLGAIVLTWWLGAYAVLFGILFLVFAFRLRHRARKASA